MALFIITSVKGDGNSIKAIVLDKSTCEPTSEEAGKLDLTFRFDAHGWEYKYERYWSEGGGEPRLWKGRKNMIVMARKT